MTDFNIDALRVAADNHREVADKADALILALEALYEGTPTAPNQPRFYVEQINGIWGVRDRENPNHWAAYGDAPSDQEFAQEEIADPLNADPSGFWSWQWSAVGEY